MEDGTNEENPSSSTLPEGSDDHKKWKIEKAQLEQVNFNLTQELMCAEEKLQIVGDMIENLLEEISRHGLGNLEFAISRGTFESTINRLTKRNIELENTVACLNMEMDNKDNAIANANRKKREMLIKMEELETNNTAQVANLEAELRCQAELTSILKNSMEESKQAADKFRDDLVTRDAVINEVKALLSEVTEEVERDRLNFSQQLAEKNEEIENLKQELENVNESLRSRHAVNVNATEEELAAMSPAAAERPFDCIIE